MRPDGLMQADTPFVDRLVADGSSTMRARTVMPSVTLPCHTSMHRGVDVPRHGITSNTFQPLARPVPGLFDVAKDQGKRTGMFYNWGELRDLMSPFAADIAYVYNDPSTAESDVIVAKAAVDHIAKTDFDLLFVYLGYTDIAGHDHGWMSQPYIDAISNADRCIERVWKAFEARGQTPNLLILSDHGGHERSHGTEMDEDMTIPWVMHGPDVRSGWQLTEPIRIFDACTTLAELVGLTPAKQWDGRIVREALR